MNDESIFNTLKEMIGPLEDSDAFDIDFLVHINTILAVLTQIGVGPTTGFEITGPDETWGMLLEESPLLNHVKTYMYLRLKKIFDPPESGTLMESIQKLIDELEWRIDAEIRRTIYKEEGEANGE